MSIHKISILISDLADLSELIPFVLLTYKATSVTYRLLRLYFGVIAFLKLCTLLTSMFKIHNMPVYHLIALWEVTLLYTMYMHLLKTDRRYYLILLVLLGFMAANTIIWEKYWEFNNIAWALNVLTLIILGIIYFYQLYTLPVAIPIENSPWFFINAGLLIYASGSFFTYLFGWKILSGQPNNFFHNAWIIQSVSILVKNTVISYGIRLIDTSGSKKA
jgi:hypothetical protein